MFARNLEMVLLDLRRPSDASWDDPSDMSRLRPVGGLSASFLGSPTLLDALERLLTSDDARRALVSVTLSMAEAGINSSGFAFLHCRDGDEVRSVSFVSELAVSLLQPGAEKTFDPLHRHAPASRQLVLNQRFFDRLASSLSYSDPSPAGSGLRSERSTSNARRSKKR